MIAGSYVKIDALLVKMSENASDSLKSGLADIRNDIREKKIFYAVRVHYQVSYLPDTTFTNLIS